jgi:transcriptional regulator with GAF, ATPase, and Fis domain
MFPLVAVALLCGAFLLSVREIRRVLVPLERLRDGTARIGEQDFETRVDVASGDEFEDLADSFNDMAGRLDKQFRALDTLAEIDRAILSTLDLAAIVGTVLRGIPRLIACDAVNVTLAARVGEGVPRSYSLKTDSTSDPTLDNIGFDDADVRTLLESADVLSIQPPERVPDYLASLAELGCERYVVLPLGGSESRPAGAISLGFAGSIAYDDEDLRQVRRLADQVAIALANVHLLEELDDLNWGALTALARTVDAKSAWTAGHSERVTRMALRIGRTTSAPCTAAGCCTTSARSRFPPRSSTSPVCYPLRSSPS